jgi:hypothetical protein
MGNFGSKEDILVEIAVLYKQMDNGKLTIDELEELVKLTGQLHERAIIVRYKAFEEKIFGVRPVPEGEESPSIEQENQEEIVVETEESVSVFEAVEEEMEAEVEVKNQDDSEEDSMEIEEPLFKVEVKQESAFGFSLFGDDLNEEVEVEREIENQVIEHPVNLDEEVVVEKDEEIIQEVINPSATPIFDVIPEVDFIQKEIVQETPEIKPMTDIERAHAENLARFFNKSQENHVNPPHVEPKVFTSDFTHEEEIMEYTSDAVDENPIEPSFYNEEMVTSETEEIIEEEIEEATLEIDDEENDVIEYQNEPVEEISYSNTFNEIIEEVSIEQASNSQPIENEFDQKVISAFIHKYNQVGSNLASQFGVSKLESLIGSFGLNERLQFINELFDGSSESFANAIKGLDQQANSENARAKVAEYAIENNWDVDSETVEEFMQKVVRRYA